MKLEQLFEEKNIKVMAQIPWEQGGNVSKLVSGKTGDDALDKRLATIRAKEKAAGSFETAKAKVKKQAETYSVKVTAKPYVDYEMHSLDLVITGTKENCINFVQNVVMSDHGNRYHAEQFIKFNTL